MLDDFLVFFSSINTLDKQRTVMPFNEAVKLSVPEFKSVPGNEIPKNIIFTPHFAFSKKAAGLNQVLNNVMLNLFQHLFQDLRFQNLYISRC